MADIVEVIKDIVRCTSHEPDPCSDCRHSSVSDDGACVDRLLNEVLEVLEEQPQWIPIKDEMPMPGDGFGTWYIVCDKYGQVFPLRYVKTKIRGKYVERWERHTGNIYYGDIVAWMPLPEPYKK